MPRVLLIATGDAIAISSDGLKTAADLLPEWATQDVTAEDLLTEPAFDMTSSTMLMLARRVRTAVLDEGYDGIVVTHGLDTIEETAFLTDLLAGPAAARSGIVFTGAVRRHDDLAPDGPRNLATALVAARDPALRLAGPVICVDGDLHAARWAARVDAIAVNGFSSAPHAPLGRVVDGRVEPLGVPPSRPPRAAGEPASDVALIKTYPGMESNVLTAVVDAGASGVVLEGTGNANVPTSLLAAISDLTDWGIPVVIASRCAGTVGEPLTLPGLAEGVGAIGARGLAAPKARLALMVASGSGNIAGVRRWFADFV